MVVAACGIGYHIGSDRTTWPELAGHEHSHAFVGPAGEGENNGGKNLSENVAMQNGGKNNSKSDNSSSR